MGLDMNLEVRFYTRHWDWQDKIQANWTVTATPPQNDIWKGLEIDPKEISSITVDIGYWRKANAIHDWFVQNVQDGEDDCKEHWVRPHKLVQLRRICKLILGKSTIKHRLEERTFLDYPAKLETREVEVPYIDNPDRYAARYLPTTSGFFFGNTEYGDLYLHNLEETIRFLDKALELGKYGTIYYSSSW